MSTNLKFKLHSGHIFDFEYFRYSDFIDNLDPQPGDIIDVLEPFTLEEFETAQIEYNKYLVFKEALEDIITTRKLWSKEELKEFSKFDFENSVLKWLMIRETREDKEIKEGLSLGALKNREMKSDNIILYCLVENTREFIPDKCMWACRRGHLKVAKWCYLVGLELDFDDEIFFREACYNGHLEVAQWLWSLGGFHRDYIHTKHQPIIDWLATLV